MCFSFYQNTDDSEPPSDAEPDQMDDDEDQPQLQIESDDDEPANEVEVLAQMEVEPADGLRDYPEAPILARIRPQNPGLIPLN